MCEAVVAANPRRRFTTLVELVAQQGEWKSSAIEYWVKRARKEYNNAKQRAAFEEKSSTELRSIAQAAAAMWKKAVEENNEAAQYAHTARSALCDEILEQRDKDLLALRESLSTLPQRDRQVRDNTYCEQVKRSPAPDPVMVLVELFAQARKLIGWERYEAARWLAKGNQRILDVIEEMIKKALEERWSRRQSKLVA